MTLRESKVKLKIPMRTGLSISIAFTLLFVSPVSAFSLKNEVNDGPCTADGRACDVYCDHGSIVGVMYWNGSVWTDGVRFNQDENTEAKAICAADRTGCT
jgi:hypothetical protein